MAASARVAFPRLDFERYHREELPALLAAGRDALAAKAARSLPALAFRRTEGGSFTYQASAGGIEVAPGDAAAATVI